MNRHTPTPGNNRAPATLVGRTIDLLCRGSMALAAITILISLALIGWAVVMRYFFNAPPVWVDEVVGHLLVATVMLAVAQTFRRGEHIGVDVLIERLPAGGKRLATAWSALVCAIVALVLIVGGWQTAMLARTLGLVTEGHLEWPTWLLMLLMPAGGALLLLATLETLWRTSAGAGLPTALEGQTTADLPKDAP